MSWYYKQKPKSTKHGYRTSNRRGKFGNTWYARNWLAPIEVDADSSRWSRGRSYVRKGQITDLRILRGEISGKVQGSRNTPYKIRIKPSKIDEKQLSKLYSYLEKNPNILLDFQDEEFSTELEHLYTEMGLFPRSINDIDYTCSCPDWGRPCKHVAAILNAVAEELDRQPFLLFLLNGYQPNDVMDKVEELIDLAGNNDTSSQLSQKNGMKRLIQFVSEEFTSKTESGIKSSNLKFDLTSINREKIGKLTKRKETDQILGLVLDQNLDKEWIGEAYTEAIEFTRHLDQYLNKRIATQTLYSNYDKNKTQLSDTNGTRLIELVKDGQIIKNDGISTSDIIEDLSQIAGVGEVYAKKMISLGVRCVYQIANDDNYHHHDRLRSEFTKYQVRKFTNNAKEIAQDNIECLHKNNPSEYPWMESYIENQTSKENTVSSSEINEILEVKPEHSSMLTKNWNKTKVLKNLKQLTGLGTSSAETLYELGVRQLSDLAYYHKRYYENNALPNTTIDIYHKQALKIVQSQNNQTGQEKVSTSNPVSSQNTPQTNMSTSQVREIENIKVEELDLGDIDDKMINGIFNKLLRKTSKKKKYTKEVELKLKDELQIDETTIKSLHLLPGKLVSTHSTDVAQLFLWILLDPIDIDTAEHLVNLKKFTLADLTVMKIWEKPRLEQKLGIKLTENLINIAKMFIRNYFEVTILPSFSKSERQAHLKLDKLHKVGTKTKLIFVNHGITDIWELIDKYPFEIEDFANTKIKRYYREAQQILTDLIWEELI